MLLEEENNSNIEVKNNDIDIKQNAEKDMGLKKLIALFAIGFAGLIILSFILQLIFYPFDLEKGAKSGIPTFITYGLIVGALFFVINKDIKLFKDDFKKWMSYLLGISIAVLIVLFTLIYTNIVNLYRPYTISDNERDLRDIIDAFPVLSVIFFCFVGPVSEELTYRVGLFNIFIKKKWLAYLIGVLVFTLVHFRFTSSDIIGELINLPVYLLSALALVFAYDKLGLAASLTAHIGNNLYAIISYLIVKNL